MNLSKKKLFPLLVLILMLACTVPAFAASPYETNGRLSIQNGKVVNAHGQPFVIKGVSTHGLSWFPEYVNKSAFQTLRDQWGVNTIRLAMYTAEYNGYCTGSTANQQKLKTLIANGVNYASSLGMYVIIDWHILSDGNPLTYKSQATTFFKEIAATYASYGNVMFEICNEPNGSEGSWKNIKSYAQAICSTIRSVNPNAIIIVGTPTWSQDVDLAAASPISGYNNIAYAFHFYADTHRSQLRSKLEGALKKSLPVIVTEFGISEASGNGSVNTSEGNLWMKLLDQYQVGRVCWNLSNKNETSALLKASCRKISGWTDADLTASGLWLKNTYTGKSTTVSSDTTTNTGTGSEANNTGNYASNSNTSNHTSTNAVIPNSVLKSAKSSGKVKLKATLKKVNGWQSGDKMYTHYVINIKNVGKKKSSKWTITIKFSRTPALSDKWCGSYKQKGNKLTIKSLSWNKRLKKNQTTELGFIISASQEPAIRSFSIKTK